MQKTVMGGERFARSNCGKMLSGGALSSPSPRNVVCNLSMWVYTKKTNTYTWCFYKECFFFHLFLLCLFLAYLNLWSYRGKKKKEFIYLEDDCFYLLKAQLRAAAGFCLPESKDVGNAHFLTSSDDVLVRQKSDKRILRTDLASWLSPMAKAGPSVRDSNVALQNKKVLQPSLRSDGFFQARSSSSVGFWPSLGKQESSLICSILQNSAFKVQPFFHQQLETSAHTSVTAFHSSLSSQIFFFFK